MKKALAWLLVLAMTAALAVGGTLAYLTDTDEDVNVMTVGKVKIDQLEYERVEAETRDDDAVVQEFHDNKPLYPAVIDKDKFNWETNENYVDWEQIGKEDYTSGIWNPENINNEVDKMVFVKNKGDFDAYVRTVIAFEAGNYETLDEFRSKVHLNLNKTDWTWEWTEVPVTIGEGSYFVATATYNKVLAPEALTEISLSQIALDPSATNEDVAGFGETYQVLVQSQAVQADGFTDPESALTEGFGEITVEDIPFDTDQPVQGVDVRTALHYLNGNTANEKITAKVSNVVFGLNKDHADVVDNYDGTLVTEEQNVDVYSYYVPENGKYTVYFLSSDLVYAPAYSRELFKGMNQLVSIDTDRLDVSKVENAYQMFMNCNKLQSLDTTGWDTSNITDMTALFYNCYELSQITGIEDWDVSSCTTLFAAFYRLYKLPKLDLSNWNTESLTNLYMAFRYCSIMTEIDLSGWDVSKVTNMESMLESCPLLETVNTTGWKPLSVENTAFMFCNDSKLKNVIGSGDWQMPANKTAKGMFNACGSLEAIDVTNWDMGKVENFHDMFLSCTSLETIQGISKWDTGSALDMVSMFNNCASLQQLENLGGWDMSTVKDTGYMFCDCVELDSLEGEENWDMGNVESMTWMFRSCLDLTALDLENWDVSNVKNFNSMFSDRTSNTGNMKLKDVDFSKWDTRSAENMSWMFYGCGQLTDLDLSNWDVSNVTTMHHMFADCLKMENYNFSGWNTESLVTIDGIFNSNRALKSVDVSAFDTQNITDFDQVFDGCSSLEEIIGLDQWNTSKGESFCEFLLGTMVREIDLSSFNMSSAKYTNVMFHVNPELTTIYVGDNWNLNLGQILDTGMFGSSPKLTGANGSTVASLGSNSADYACVDTEETPGLLTHINDKPVNP